MITESAPGRLKLLRDSASGVGCVGGGGRPFQGQTPLLWGTNSLPGCPRSEDAPREGLVVVNFWKTTRKI